MKRGGMADGEFGGDGDSRAESMKRSIIWTVVVALLLSCSVVHAEWVVFDKGASSYVPALTADGRLDDFVVDIDVPAVDITRDGAYVVVRMADEPWTMVKEEPELPVLTTSIVLPDEGTPRVRLEVLEQVEIPLPAKIRPSRGHLTRDVDPATVPLKEGACYSSREFIPSPRFEVSVGSPYIMRDFRGAAVRIHAVLYNPARSVIKVLKRARLHVEMVRDGASVNAKVRREKVVSSEFAFIYGNLFVNYGMALKAMNNPDEKSGRALVICPREWTDELQPLLRWRAVKGIPTRLVTVEEILADAGEDGKAKLTPTVLKNFIQKEYDAGGLTWILLVGDADRIPPMKGVYERADSDACYVKLEGDDHVPDAFISRFSAKKAEEVAVQVARAVSYEKEPLTGEAAVFYRRALGIASNEGSPKDWERAEWLREALMEAGYDKVDKVYDPGASKQAVAAAVNEGRALINYIGHGSKSMWVTSYFSVDDVYESLTNTGGRWPMIWSVACVNGDFVYGLDCFCEAWAKAGTREAPTGAVGIVGASTNMSWVPPCDWQNAIVISLMIPGVVTTGGALHHYGLVKAMEKWGDTAHSEGVKLVEQCVYFGDSSVEIRTNEPVTPECEVAGVQGREVTFRVVADRKPVAGARIVIDGDDDAVVCTGEDGTAKVLLEQNALEDGKVVVNVTGPNLVPLLEHEVALK